VQPLFDSNRCGANATLDAQRTRVEFAGMATVLLTAPVAAEGVQGMHFEILGRDQCLVGIASPDADGTVCCSVLRCAAGCCGVLRCVAVYCSVLQYVAICCNVLAVSCSVLQCLGVAVCCSVLQCVAVCCSILVCCRADAHTAPMLQSHSTPASPIYIRVLTYMYS